MGNTYQTPKEILASDRAIFFQHVFDQDITLEELIKFYISFDGPIFNDQKAHLIKKLDKLFFDHGITQDASDILSKDSSVTKEFLIRYFPHLARSYFEDGDHLSFIRTTILPPSTNLLKDPLLPRPINRSLSRAERPPFDAWTTHSKVTLFVGPNQYQLFNSETEVRYPAAALRSYSKNILTYSKYELSGPAFLIQDCGDGGNFAHFAFDWVTRIMHSFEAGLVKGHEFTFIMGGTKHPFQRLLIERIKEIYDCRSGTFLYPERRILLECSDGITFFSDQNITPQHPAQLAHPSSMKLLRELSLGVSVKSEAIRKVYISRRDATLRKVSNEDDIIRVARNYGFEIFQMADLLLDDQISIVRGARYVIGPHGMGLTHIIFNAGPLSVLELFHPTIGTDAYAMISKACDFHYGFIIGTDDNDNKGSYKIDPETFDLKVRELLNDD